MARNVTVRFDDDKIVAEIEAVSDVIGVSLSEFIREAAKKHIGTTKRRPDFADLVEAERERVRAKFAAVGESFP